MRRKKKLRILHPTEKKKFRGSQKVFSLKKYFFQTCFVSLMFHFLIVFPPSTPFCPPTSSILYFSQVPEWLPQPSQVFWLLKALVDGQQGTFVSTLVGRLLQPTLKTWKSQVNAKVRLNLVIFVPLKASHPIIFHQKYRGQGYDLISDGCWKFLLSCGRSIRLTGDASLRKIELQSPSVTEVLLEWFRCHLSHDAASTS